MLLYLFFKDYFDQNFVIEYEKTFSNKMKQIFDKMDELKEKKNSNSIRTTNLDNLRSELVNIFDSFGNVSLNPRWSYGSFNSVDVFLYEFTDHFTNCPLSQVIKCLCSVPECNNEHTYGTKLFEFTQRAVGSLEFEKSKFCQKCGVFTEHNLYFPQFGEITEYLPLLFNQWYPMGTGHDILFDKIKYTKIPTSSNKTVVARAIYSINYNGSSHFTSNWEFEEGNEFSFDDIREKNELIMIKRVWNPKHPTLLLYKSLSTWKTSDYKLHPAAFRKFVFSIVCVLFKKLGKIARYFRDAIINIVLPDFYKKYQI